MFTPRTSPLRQVGATICPNTPPKGQQRSDKPDSKFFDAARRENRTPDNIDLAHHDRYTPPASPHKIAPAPQRLFNSPPADRSNPHAKTQTRRLAHCPIPLPNGLYVLPVGGGNVNPFITEGRYVRARVNVHTQKTLHFANGDFAKGTFVAGKLVSGIAHTTRYNPDGSIQTVVIGKVVNGNLFNGTSTFPDTQGIFLINYICINGTKYTHQGILSALDHKNFSQFKEQLTAHGIQLNENDMRSWFTTYIANPEN